MPARWKTLCATLTGSFAAALALAAAFMVFVGWDQSHWWRIKEDYSFGWLVPAFVGFVIYDRWPKIVAAVAACRVPGSPRARGWAKWVWRVVMGASLAGGVLLFLLGAFYRAGAGTSQPGTLAITLGAAGIILPLLFLNAPVAETGAPGVAGGHGPLGERTLPAQPRPPADGGLWADARWRLTALFLFPVLVWLVSAPLVSAIETQLNLFLLHKVVGVVSVVFDLLGLPVEQQGNVLVLPNGSVGVEDACSGIRSLTGCLFAGSFLAAVFLDRLWRKVLLVIAALVLAVLTNLLRGLFLTGWAYRHGAQSIEGTVHDAAGYAVLALTVIGLLCLLPLLNLGFGDDGEEEPRGLREKPGDDADGR